MLKFFNTSSQVSFPMLSCVLEFIERVRFVFVRMATMLMCQTDVGLSQAMIQIQLKTLLNAELSLVRIKGIAIASQFLMVLGMYISCLVSVEASEPEGLADCTIRSQKFGGDVWELSTRHLGCVHTGKSGWLNQLKVSRWNGAQWVGSDLGQALYQSSESIASPRTIVYIHGNWMERDNARERVRIIDRYTSRRATEPYRIIMLSWPSEKNERILQDIRGNAQLSDANAVIGAEILGALAQSPTQVSLIGFSLGARTVTGSLQLDAQNPVSHPAYRVSLIAPAVDRSRLQPGGKDSLALTNVERMVNLYNSRDPVLRRFRFIDAFSSPIAAGFAGFGGIANPRSTTPLDRNELIRQYDCGSAIGTTHSEKSYYSECPYFAAAVDNLLGK